MYSSMQAQLHIRHSARLQQLSAGKMSDAALEVEEVDARLAEQATVPAGSRAIELSYASPPWHCTSVKQGLSP